MTASRNTPGLRPALQIALFPVLLLIIFSRRPGDLLHAQFFAEDGRRWFAQAYNLGWLRALPIPDASYLQLLPRLGSGLALLAPLRYAPLFTNLVGASLQALPVTVLLSRRAEPWGSLRLRSALCVLYLGCANALEVHVNITNAQWHLALIVMVLGFGRPPEGRLARAGDVLLFLIASVSGPFGGLILPLLLLRWWGERSRWTLVEAGCLVAGLVFQIRTLLTGAPLEMLRSQSVQFARSAAERPLGATPALFVRIVGGNMFFGAAAGPLARHAPLAVDALFLVLSLAVIGAAFAWGPRAFRLFVIFSALVVAAALRDPVVFGTIPRWQSLALIDGIRYDLFPALALLWSAVYVVHDGRALPIRSCGALILLLSLLGLGSWRYPVYREHYFSTFARRFEAAPRGTTMTFPLVPDGWSMTLVKH